MSYINKIFENTYFKQVVEYFQQCKVKKTPNASYILLDGGLSTTHNILINCLIGIVVNQKKQLNLAHLTGVHDPTIINKVFTEGLGSEEIKIADYYHNTYVKWRYRLEKLRFILFYKNKNILSYTIDGILVGDLLYDTVIRFNNEVYSAKKINVKDRIFIYQGLLRFFACQAILKKYNIDYIVLSHKYYIYFGFMPRLVLKKGGKVISDNRGHLRLIHTQEEMLRNDHIFDSTISKQLAKIDISLPESFVESRFLGRFDNFDVKNAFVNKVHYTREEIIQLFNFDAKLPIAAILPHAFSDVPHCHAFMLYEDYYQWFLATLKIIDKVPQVNWLIKPHPSSEMYFEGNLVATLVHDLTKRPNIKLVPSDIHTESIFKVADSVITVRGTAGLEAALYDIRAIISGDAVYDQIGITVKCTTKEEYEHALHSITFKTKISDEIKTQVKLCMYWWHKLTIVESNIFPKEIVPNMPDEEVFQYDINAYKRAAEFLLSNGLEGDEYYQKLIEFIEKDRERLSGIDFLSSHYILQ